MLYTFGEVLKEMLSKEARIALIGRKSHGFRIIKASFKTKKDIIIVNAIQCYAQTNYNNDDDKCQFYLRLQSIISKCARNNMTILMADLNVKIGMDNTGYEDKMG
ncbi:unnamed protein product [Schistosoma margrebowiei]|uniref:Uncharacterized protein n=1 Tax=Schistosoma margrebowiei TaxID=48269 RepID=A0A183LKI3_9TREM|nr:unnamed protein product [Schistosoma margrebowiei]